MMKNRLRWLVVVALISLLFFVVLAVRFQDFVRQSIVIPVLYMMWVGGKILNSVPQMFYLLGLVGIGVLLAIASLRYLLAFVRLPAEPPPPIEEPTRYQFWFKRCRRLSSSAFFATSMSIELRRFALSVLAYQEHCDMWDLERAIVNQEFDVPPEVYELIAQRNLVDLPEERNILDFLREFFSGFSEPSGNALDGRTEQRLHLITAYLEKRLEVEYD